jgi:spore coat protein U-like protein
MNFGFVNLTLGTAINGSATYSFSCTGQANRTVRLCLNIGQGANPALGGGAQRVMSSGANSMLFNLYVDVARTTIWGSYRWPYAATYPGVQVDLVLNASGVGSTSRTVYGRIFAGQQTLPTGSYNNNFNLGEERTEYDYTDITPKDCKTSTFCCVHYPSFNAFATYAAVCRVSATNMDFPPGGQLTANVDQTSSLSITCSNGTPWTTGLNNGTGVGASGPTDRRMTGPAGAQIVYGLYRDAARSLPWGSTLGQTSAGTGTGLSQAATVYGRVAPQATPAPGLYSDTIVVTVTY